MLRRHTAVRDAARAAGRRTGYLGAPQLPQNLIPAATRVPHLVHGEGEDGSGAVRGASCGDGAGAGACWTGGGACTTGAGAC